MRVQLNAVVAFLLVGLILSTMAPHCLFDDDELVSVQASDITSHTEAQSHDHDGKNGDDDCCKARADLEAGQLPQVATSSPPQIKHIIVWPTFKQADLWSVSVISHPSFHGPNPRASPGRFLSAPHTGRLLI